MARPYRILDSEVTYRWRGYRLVADKVLLDTGTEITKHTLVHPGAVVVIPRLADGSLLLLHQYRHSVDQYLLEFPAGTLEPGEVPIECARREIVEETGYRARDWLDLGILHPAPGFCDEVQYTFLAEHLSPEQGNPDEDEFIELRPMSVDDFERAIASGSVTDGKTLALFARARARQLL